MNIRKEYMIAVTKTRKSK